MGQTKGLKRPNTPEAWAIKVTRVLDAVLGGVNRFPVRVRDVALEYASKCYPDDPIERVHGDALPGFDGALLRLPGKKHGWTILYNNAFRSEGRVNFTLAHEFGHYLVHRAHFPEGIRCTQEDVARFESAYKATETEANTFAAYLLMPFHDYREQIAADRPTTWGALSNCASRYNVSLIAATLRWLDFTQRRAMLVVSTDGFVLWAKSSQRALRTGLFLRTRTSTIPLPEASPARLKLALGRDVNVEHGPGVWFSEPAIESVIRSDAYDFTLSLLQFGSAPERPRSDEGNEEEGVITASDFIRSPFSRTP